MGELRIFQNKIVQLILATSIPFLGGVLLFLLLADRIQELEDQEKFKPSYEPPGYVVGIAWTLLYLLSGYASWRVYNIGKKRKINVKIPLLFYSITLMLNWLWTLIAFGLNYILAAIVEMIILNIFVAITGVLFYKIDKISGAIFVPYFLYLIYATVVTTHVYILNS